MDGTTEFEVRTMPTKFKVVSLFEYLFRLKRWHVIADIINHHKFTTYAEVGVEMAKTTSYLLKHCPTLTTVYAIDNYPIYELCSAKMQKCRQRIAQKRLNDHRVRFIKETSETSSNLVPNNLDIVFIDANHRYEFVKQDIELWYPKLREGGILIGHDYSLRNFGVVKAVHERFRYIYTSDDRIWWVYKNEKKI